VLLEEHPHPGVVLLRLHRPAALNALNLQLRHALAEAFTRLDADPAVQVIVMAGSEKAFCAGADLTEYRDADPLEIMARRMGLLWDAIGHCSKPVIAAVRGWALGGGLEYALTENLSTKIEYLHAQFGNGGGVYTSPDDNCYGFLGDRKNSIDIVRVGLNYRFVSAAPAPVLARY
jgi:1,4-dihydroxy-2-naphthoyl-CoA synthase